MREILIDYGRKHQAKKRGGEFTRVPLHESEYFFARDTDSLLALDEALERLGKHDLRAMRVVELKFFGGLTTEEIGELLDLSVATVEREWRFARAWLFEEVAGARP